MKLLIIAILVLAVIAIAQLSKVHENVVRLSGRREEDIPARDHRTNGRLFWYFAVAYFAFIAWLMIAYGDQLLTISASKHGVLTDQLLNWNWILIFIVFVITNVLLFLFAGKYYFKTDRKAFFYPHNNKLELIWTIVPAVVMMGIIVLGLNAWNKITALPDEGTMNMELYAKQFDWTARYPGADGRLGATDFRLIDDAGNNPLGIVTRASVAARLVEVNAAIEEHKMGLKTMILPDDAKEEKEETHERLIRTRQRIIDMRTIMENDIKERKDQSPYLAGADDIVVKEFRLPVNEQVNMVFRSRDVIHSAYIPHMRAQMNCVPGISTTFKMTPIYTTAEFRKVKDNDKLNYVLMCNKICGASHYNMQMDLVVEEQEAYDTWLAALGPFEGGEDTEETTTEVAVTTPKD